MPQVILNQALYQDRTVQDWHRESFCSSDWAIDLDLLGACNSCREPLYLIEATTNPNKPLSILRRLAERSNLPALVIMHDTERVLSGRTIWPTSVDLPEEKWVRSVLTIYRQNHLQECHSRPFDYRKVSEVSA
jgi:hypothetical protein